MILIDSSVWIDFFRGRSTRQSDRLHEFVDDDQDILLGDLVLCEVLLGARDDRNALRMEMALREFPVVQLLDPKLAVAAAANYRQLRANGITIRRTIDLIIGTYCIEYGHHLLHSDRDFEPMERLLGLRVI
jgi:predicted nucleic acid-binding protein